MLPTINTDHGNGREFFERVHRPDSISEEEMGERGKESGTNCRGTAARNGGPVCLAIFHTIFVSLGNINTCRS
jgi:hypothetical protein